MLLLLLKDNGVRTLLSLRGCNFQAGVTLNGRQIIEDANQEIEVARQRLYNEYDTPPDFFMG